MFSLFFRVFPFRDGLSKNFILGGDLREFLEVVGSIEEEEAVLWFAEMIMAVHTLHNLGYIHRRATLQFGLYIYIHFIGGGWRNAIRSCYFGVPPLSELFSISSAYLLLQRSEARQLPDQRARPSRARRLRPFQGQ